MLYAAAGGGYSDIYKMIMADTRFTPIKDPAENLALATYGVWIHLPLLERRERKRLRDGSLNMEHWDFWAMQERAFYQRERPDLIAHTVLDSGSNVLSPEKTDD